MADYEDWFNVTLTDAHSGAKMTYLVTEVILHGIVERKIRKADLVA